MDHHIFNYNQPFGLECGEVLPHLQIQHPTLEKSDHTKNNVVWVCHASGIQNAGKRAKKLSDNA